MPLGLVRVQLIAFVLLSAGVGINVLAFQPQSWQRVAATTTEPASGQAALGPNGVFLGNTGSIDGGAASADGKAIAAAVVIPRDSADITRAVQRELKAHGYETGAIDGVVGSMTRAAIMAFEFDHGMALSGTPDQALLKTILMGAEKRRPARVTRAGGPSSGQSAEAESVITSVQRSLAGLGYRPGPINGQLTPETARAIREFEVDQALTESGRISGPLVARLARLSSQGRIASAP